MALTYQAAAEMMKTARNGTRKLGHNTYLYARGAGHVSPPDTYAVRYHSTDVVLIHRDGTYTLNSNGWHTTTTVQRINDYSPARVYSGNGQWCVWHRATDPITPPRIQKCRTCHGTGSYHRAYMAGDSIPCYRCDGTGRHDYGSKSDPVIFYDGIRVDGTGKVLDADAERMVGTPEQIERKRQEAKRKRQEAKRRERLIARHAARYLRKQRANWRATLPAGNLTDRPNIIKVYKAVDDALYSGYRFRYPIGETVTAPDWEPNMQCGAGLHFCLDPRTAKHDYYPAATRFLECEVDARYVVPLGNKVKVKRARVVREVDIWQWLITRKVNRNG